MSWTLLQNAMIGILAVFGLAGFPAMLLAAEPAGTPWQAHLFGATAAIAGVALGLAFVIRVWRAVQGQDGDQEGSPGLGPAIWRELLWFGLPLAVLVLLARSAWILWL